VRVYSWLGYAVCLLLGHKDARIILNGEDLGSLCMRCGYHEDAP
jgi:hypothetical protein